MFVERVTALHRASELVEVKASIFNALIKYFLLIRLFDKKKVYLHFFL